MLCKRHRYQFVAKRPNFVDPRIKVPFHRHYRILKLISQDLTKLIIAKKMRVLT